MTRDALLEGACQQLLGQQQQLYFE